jgi:hypothetical protein
VELCEFIVDDRGDRTKKEPIKIDGEKNNFKHLGIMKNGTRYTAQGAGKKKKHPAPSLI